MKKVMESAQKILSGKNFVLNKGGIGSKTTQETDPTLLVKRIEKFGGVGWLLTTKGMKERFSGSTGFEELGFIICGELSDGDKTIQITMMRMGWAVSEKWVDPNMDALYETLRYCRHHGNEMAVYQVSYESVEMFGHRELQPVNYRFVGWEGR